MRFCPLAKVTYQDHGTDPRNYRVSFAKVENMLGFKPAKTIEDGIIELLDALDNGIFNGVGWAENKFGNYSLEHLSG